MIRRILLGVGAALLVGGFSAMWFAHEENANGADGALWLEGLDAPSGRSVFVTGAAAAVAGAMVLGLSVPRERRPS